MAKEEEEKCRANFIWRFERMIFRCTTFYSANTVNFDDAHSQEQCQLTQKNYQLVSSTLCPIRFTFCRPIQVDFSKVGVNQMEKLSMRHLNRSIK